MKPCDEQLKNVINIPKIGMLEDKLIQYMDSDSEKFISILLLARQASLEPQGTVYILGQ